MQPFHCWAFECGSIQSFILETGRLSDAVGASLLVDRLTGDLDEALSSSSLLQSVLQAAQSGTGPDTAVRFSRRGGGSFIAFFDSARHRERVRMLWHAALAANVPGLRWADAVSEGATAMEAAQRALDGCQQAGRIDRPRWPEAGPLVRRVPRTGQPAVALAHLPGGREEIDAATVVRRNHSSVSAVTGTLLQRFGHDKQLCWPTNMDPAEEEDSPRLQRRSFPFRGASREVAFLHADGNGLGVLLHRLAKECAAEDYEKTYAAFSRAVTAATVEAARLATKSVLLPGDLEQRTEPYVVPARPLVLGGDDLTMIVRADLALPFAEAFLKAFEEASTRELSGVRLNGQALPGLTAACGIAIVKASFPFAQAATLAEHLCQRAKAVIKREAQDTGRGMPLSALALEEVTNAVPDEELPQVCVDGHQWPLGCAAYVLDPRPGAPLTTVPTLKQLQALTNALGNHAMPRGPLRSLLTDLYQHPQLGRERYQRWRANLARNDSGKEQLVAIDRLLQDMGVAAPQHLPLGQAGTPWPDALLVRDLRALAETKEQAQ